MHIYRITALAGLLALGGAGLAATATMAAAPAGTTAVYDSNIASPSYSQAFNGTQIEELGNEVTLASTGALADVTVGFSNFSADAFTSLVTVTFYSTTGTQLTSDTETVTVPTDGGYGADTPTDGIAVFNWTFSGFSPAVTLPATVVYGISLDALNSDCASTPADCGNDPNDVGSLNVNLADETSSDLSVGADANPGNVWVEENPAIAGTGPGEEITCGSLPTPEAFAQVSTATCNEGNDGLSPYVPTIEIDVTTPVVATPTPTATATPTAVATVPTPVTGGADPGAPGSSLGWWIGGALLVLLGGAALVVRRKFSAAQVL
jgi:hypothetical protein